MEKPKAYIVYNDIESKHCQEMLFELGYKWYSYGTEYAKIPLEYPCVIYEEYYHKLSYSNLNFFKEEFCDFLKKDFYDIVNYRDKLRKKKLEKILND